MHLRLLISLLLLSLALSAQQSTNTRVLARAELGNANIIIGDQVWLEVTISVPPSTTVEPLQAGFINEVTGIEAIEEKALMTIATTPELLLQQRILITSFDTGYISIPQLPYLYVGPDGKRDTAFTNDLLLTVRTLPVGEDDELQPIKPIIREPVNAYDFWWVFLLGVLGLIGYVSYSRFKASRRVEVAPPPPPADLKALNALKDLEKQGLWEKGSTKEYYSALTKIFREFLESRFQVPAMEMTSRQINTALELKSDLSEEQLSEMSRLLQLSDMVKFAKATPEAELHVQSIDRVRTFVRKAGPKPEPIAVPTPPAPASAASSQTATKSSGQAAPATKKSEPSSSSDAGNPQPATTAIPATPLTPATTATPATPATPATTAIPATPVTTATPATPATPAIPATPVTTATPATPATPATTAIPATPATTATPPTPVTTATPATTATPPTPVTTATPVTPVTPATRNPQPATPNPEEE
jgi:hypothetical protein